MGCKCGNPTQDNVTEFKPEAIVSNYITTETLKKKEEEEEESQEYLEYPREIQNMTKYIDRLNISDTLPKKNFFYFKLS